MIARLWGRIMLLWPAARTVVAVLMSCGFAAGCAGPGLDSPEAKATKVINDNFLPYQELTTALLRSGNGTTEIATMRLIGRRDRKNGSVTTHAVVAIHYHQKLGRRYETARNANTELLPLHRLQNEGTGCRKENGCVHFEEFLIDIPEPQLREANAAGKGYPIKLFARAGGGTEYPIPPVLVASLMGALDGAPTGGAAAKIEASQPKAAAH